MKKAYKGGGRGAGVVSYELGASSIMLEFADGKHRYLYNEDAPGPAHVEAMKQLAVAGEGLSTYINRHVRDRYAGKLPIEAQRSKHP